MNQCCTHYKQQDGGCLLVNRARNCAGNTRGRKGGRPRALAGEKKALAFEALQNRNKSVKELPRP